MAEGYPDRLSLLRVNENRRTGAESSRRVDNDYVTDAILAAAKNDNWKKGTAGVSSLMCILRAIAAFGTQSTSLISAAVIVSQDGLHQVAELVGRESIALDIGHQLPSPINDGSMQRMVHSPSSGKKSTPKQVVDALNLSRRYR